MSEGDLGKLMESPYDDEPEEQAEAIPWIPPVIGAVVGALFMAGYVFFAIETGPTETTVDHSSAATTVAQSATGLPGSGGGSSDFVQGYSPVSADVAFAADGLVPDSEGVTLFVSSVARSGADPLAILPVDIALWKLSTPAGEEPMVSQSGHSQSPGSATVRFGSLVSLENVVVLASLPGAVEETVETVALEASDVFHWTLRNYLIEGPGFAVVIEDFSADFNGGQVVWRLERGLSAKVDTVVSIGVGEDLYQFVAPHAATPSRRGSVLPAPLWSTSGSSQLVLTGSTFGISAPGESIEGHGGVPSKIHVEFWISVVTEAGETFEIPLSGVIQP